MARATPWLSNFTAGELTPRLDGRQDIDWYGNGTRLQRNLVSLPHGPAMRRSGTRFVEEVKDSAKATILLPFQAAVDQTYQVEAGDLYFRFYSDKARVEDPPGTPVEVVSPYAAADLADLSWLQSFDAMFLFHPAYQPRRLNRASHTSWSLGLHDFVDGPYLAENADTAKTLAPSATTGAGITITAVGHAPFAATDVGRLVRINHAGTWGNAKIVGFTSTTVVTADVKVDFGAITASSAWRLGLWSDTTGWPACGGFFGERLFTGGVPFLPNRFDASLVGDFSGFTPGAANADPISGTLLGADKISAIRWFKPADGEMLAGTQAGVAPIGSDDLKGQVTPANVSADKLIRPGVADTPPVEAGPALLYLQRHGAKLRELSFDIRTDGFIALDLSRRADHLAGPGTADPRIVEIAYQEEPWSIVWARRDDGLLLGCTNLRDEQVLAWHRHPIGASAAGAAVVESISTIAGANGDELWMVVRRTIDGTTKRYVEVLEDFFGDATALADAFFVDSGLSYDGAPVTSVSGLDHLEGESVQVLADGANHPPRVVSAGAISLDGAASKVHAGLAAPARLKPIRLEAGAREGTAQGKTQRIDGLAVRLYRTLGLKVGPSEARLDDVSFRRPEDPMDSAPPLFTGDKQVIFDGDFGEAPELLLGQDAPLPFTLVALGPRVNPGEG